MSDARNKGTLIKNSLNDLSRAHYVYDTESRVSAMYVADATAANGDPCLKTTFTYVGLTALVETFIEEESTWEAWLP